MGGGVDVGAFEDGRRCVGEELGWRCVGEELGWEGELGKQAEEEGGGTDEREDIVKEG